MSITDNVPFIKKSQGYAATQGIAPRSYFYTDNAEGTSNLLWIAGRKNVPYWQTGSGSVVALSNDPGSVHLSLEGRMETHHPTEKLQASLSGQMNYEGQASVPQGQPQPPGFNIPGRKYSFMAKKTLANGQEVKTGVNALSLTPENNTNGIKATFIRLSNQQDDSFINKIYIGDGRAIEVEYKQAGQKPSRISTDFTADKQFTTQWKDTQSPEDQQALTTALKGPNVNQQNQANAVSDELKAFAKSTGLSVKGVLYRLGMVNQPENASNPQRTQPNPQQRAEHNHQCGQPNPQSNDLIPSGLEPTEPNKQSDSADPSDPLVPSGLDANPSPQQPSESLTPEGLTP